MKTGALKAYLVVIGLMCVLFGLWLSKRAFVGKRMDKLAAVDADIDAQSHHTSPQTTPDQPSQAQAPTPAPAQTPDPAAQPQQQAIAAAAAPTPVATASPAPEASATPDPSKDPEKGSMGDAMKTIRERNKAHNASLEKALDQ